VGEMRLFVGMCMIERRDGDSMVHVLLPGLRVPTGAVPLELDPNK